MKRITRKIAFIASAATLVAACVETTDDVVVESFPSEIAPTGNCVPRQCIGDFDDDLKTDFSDFLLLQSLYGTADPRADIDGDGIVEFADFLAFSDNFGCQSPGLHVKLTSLQPLPAGSEYVLWSPGPSNLEWARFSEFSASGDHSLTFRDLEDAPGALYLSVVEVGGLPTQLNAIIHAVGDPSDSSLVIGYDMARGNTEVRGLGRTNVPPDGISRVYCDAPPTCPGQDFIKASDADLHDRFGSAMATDGDYMAVGATNGNAVYVFRKVAGPNGPSWLEEAILQGNDTEAGDLFGSGVALNGDLLVVGAKGKGAGAAYVFRRQPTGAWTQEISLLGFGAVVAATDNVIAVTPGAEPGAVSIFEYDPSGWSLGTTIKDATGAVDARALSLDGDTLVIGNSEDNSGAPESGVVQIFVRDPSGQWAEEALLQGSNTDAFDLFGSSVLIDGDKLFVGAVNQGPEQFDAGAVYVFSRSDSQWTETAYLKDVMPAERDAFGASIAYNGDLLAVGVAEKDAEHADFPPINAGAVVLYEELPSGDWKQIDSIQPEQLDANDNFGSAVAFVGDTLVVASPDDDSAAQCSPSNNDLSASGAIYVVSTP